MRKLAILSLLSALSGLACTAPTAVANPDLTSGSGAPPPDLEVSVRMASEPEKRSNDGEGDLESAELATDTGEKQDLNGPEGPAKLVLEAPPPPPPPDVDNLRQKSKERPTLQAATADSAGAKVDSATIQQAIAKNVASFRPCLRADMALRLDATISPSGDVLEAQSSRSFPDDAKARECVVLALKRLRFERFDGSVPARVSFELTLKRALDY